MASELPQSSRRLTSLSSGLRYAQPLNSSVMQNQKDKNISLIPVDLCHYSQGTSEYSGQCFFLRGF